MSESSGEICGGSASVFGPRGRATAPQMMLLLLTLAASLPRPGAAQAQPACTTLGPFDLRAKGSNNCNLDRARADAVTNCVDKQASLYATYAKVRACASCGGSGGASVIVSDFKPATATGADGRPSCSFAATYKCCFELSRAPGNNANTAGAAAAAANAKPAAAGAASSTPAPANAPPRPAQPQKEAESSAQGDAEGGSGGQADAGGEGADAAGEQAAEEEQGAGQALAGGLIPVRIGGGGGGDNGGARTAPNAAPATTTTATTTRLGGVTSGLVNGLVAPAAGMIPVVGRRKLFGVCQSLGSFELHLGGASCSFDRARIAAADACADKMDDLSAAFAYVRPCTACAATKGAAFALDDFKAVPSAAADGSQSCTGTALFTCCFDLGAPKKPAASGSATATLASSTDGTQTSVAATATLATPAPAPAPKAAPAPAPAKPAGSGSSSSNSGGGSGGQQRSASVNVVSSGSGAGALADMGGALTSSVLGAATGGLVGGGGSGGGSAVGGLVGTGGRLASGLVPLVGRRRSD